ncbi:MAG: 30S ribosomal protein S12 methylthiotransferase RimO, partial [Flavisolibacter sp.]
EISLGKNSGFVGKELTVIIDGIEGSFYVGRSYRDAPEVDGEVLIPLNGNALQPGSFCTVRINDYNEYDLYGKVIHIGRS